MDTIFYNGIIHTLDKAYPEVSAPRPASSTCRAD